MGGREDTERKHILHADKLDLIYLVIPSGLPRTTWSDPEHRARSKPCTTLHVTSKQNKNRVRHQQIQKNSPNKHPAAKPWKNRGKWSKENIQDLNLSSSLKLFNICFPFSDALVLTGYSLHSVFVYWFFFLIELQMHNDGSFGCDVGHRSLQAEKSPQK